jgi:hypothetical protein
VLLIVWCGAKIIQWKRLLQWSGGHNSHGAAACPASLLDLCTACLLLANSLVTAGHCFIMLRLLVYCSINARLHSTG